MAFLGETFSTDSLPVSDRSYDLIPEGWYNATITKAELNNTKAGTGQKIDMRYDIVGPTQQGRVVFGTVNVRNQSQKAEEIGRQQLGEIMRAVGLAKIQDTDELVGGSICVRVKIRPAENGYDARNEVSGFKSASGALPQVTSTSAPEPTAQPGGAKPPWAK
ncbi:MAG TPA: DUF669 domain-containing protein [Pseudomonadales bacterium]|nr:DUF669 domain-containing protein [Pseudomonadales bacterium]